MGWASMAARSGLSACMPSMLPGARWRNAGWNTSGPLAARSSAQTGRRGLLRRISSSPSRAPGCRARLPSSVGRGHEDHPADVWLGLEDEHLGELVAEGRERRGPARPAARRSSPRRTVPLDWTRSRLAWPPVLLPTMTIRSRAGSIPRGSNRRRISRSERRIDRAAVGSEYPDGYSTTQNWYEPRRCRIAAECIEHRHPGPGAGPDPCDEDDRHLAGLVRVEGVDTRPFVVELGIEHAQVFVVPDRALRQAAGQRGGQVRGHGVTRPPCSMPSMRVGSRNTRSTGVIAQLAADPRGRTRAVAANVARWGPNGLQSASSASCRGSGGRSGGRRGRRGDPWPIPVTIRSSVGSIVSNPSAVHSGTVAGLTTEMIPAAASRSGQPLRPGWSSASRQPQASRRGAVVHGVGDADHGIGSGTLRCRQAETRRKRPRRATTPVLRPSPGPSDRPTWSASSARASSRAGSGRDAVETRLRSPRRRHTDRAGPGRPDPGGPAGASWIRSSTDTKSPHRSATVLRRCPGIGITAI